MSSIAEVYEKQRNFFYSGKSKDIAFRKENLKKFRSAIIRYESKMKDAWSRLLADSLVNVSPKGDRESS